MGHEPGDQASRPDYESFFAAGEIRVYGAKAGPVAEFNVDFGVKAEMSTLGEGVTDISARPLRALRVGGRRF